MPIQENCLCACTHVCMCMYKHTETHVSTCMQVVGSLKEDLALLVEGYIHVSDTIPKVFFKSDIAF